MQQRTGILSIETRGEGFAEIGADLNGWLHQIGANEGLVTLFLRHTSASLTIQENADPAVCADLLEALRRIAPQDHPYRHNVEGPDDMPSHIRAMLTSVSLQIPVVAGTPLLGTWQGIFVIEHRATPRRREVAVHFLGELE